MDNHNLFMHSLIDGHLGCFQFVVITNEAVIIIIVPACTKRFMLRIGSYLHGDWQV